MSKELDSVFHRDVMKTIKLFTDEQIENNPVIKDAIDYGWKRGYNVNEWFVLEPEDYESLL